MAGVPTQAAAPNALVVAVGTLNPAIQLVQPWPRYAGSLGTSLVAFPAVAGRSMTLVGTEVEAFLPEFRLFQHQSGRGTYALVGCNSQAYFAPNANLDPRNCIVVADPPDGRVTIVNGRLAPVNPLAWRPMVNNSLFGTGASFRVPSSATGLYVGVKFVAEGLDNGVVTATTTGSSSSVLVLPYDYAPAVRPVLLTAPPTAGAVVQARRAQWDQALPYVQPLYSTDLIFVCERAAAAADTRTDWATVNGCRQLDDIRGGDALRLAPVESRLAAGDAGRFVLIQSTLYGQQANNGIPGVFTWTHRTPAIRIAAAPAEAGGGGGNPPAAAADGSSGGGVADAQSGAGGSDAAGSGAVAVVGTETAAAVGAGVDLAVAPLAGANGQGVGIASGLNMQVAASSRVNRGRRITVKAVLTPSTSKGRVLMTLVRFNARGNAVRGSVFTKPLVRGEAIRRWRVAKTFRPGTFTLVVTYVPSQPGAPGITRTLPVQIG